MTEPSDPTAARLMLPPMFKLHRVDEVDDILDAGTRLAADGAQEGTVLWAECQRQGRSVGGRRWHAPPGNAHCALVLQPDYGNSVLPQLAYVASVAAGEALAGLLEPMTGLRYRWPTTLLINELVAGQVRLAAPAVNSDPLPWLVISLSVNVAHHPPNPEPERFNSVHASGSRDVGAENVIEDFMRYFLRWINVWAEDGFEPVRRSYTLRAEGFGEQGDATQAPLATLDQQGRVLLTDPAASPRERGVEALFALPQEDLPQEDLSQQDLSQENHSPEDGT